ncbi:glycosyltransferase [Arthrobacter wenxiniae]|uniref:Glycosyltransferase n=1 Tax=Arthrobacter wenxiniae TaxID=2713570 RepID=A0A7Y7IG36_9MICC|nr:glycosyltransferase [Arthrobacter wenxiniae]NVM94850.1 glycosyltransferase [Arthrobacter wenxiniae]
MSTTQTHARKIIVFPYWADNAFIDIMYMASASRGMGVVKSYFLEDLHQKVVNAAAGDVVHVHWTTRVCQEASDELDAASRLARFQDTLHTAKDGGLKIIWTVHNAMAHESRFEDVETELYRFLADIADTIHIMNPQTAEFVRPTFEIPEGKVVCLPHPSYRGWYDANLGRPAARSALRLPQNAKAVLFFGNIKPYKGVLDLIAAVQCLQEIDPSVHLLLAGRVSDDDRSALDAALSTGVRHIKELGYISAEDTPRWFKAADLMVVPYRRSLNSGSLQLAASFDLPCLVPNQAELQAVYGGEPWVDYYDGGGAPRELAFRMAAALAEAPRRRRSAYEFSRRYPPFEMSNDFADLVAQL